MTLRTSDVQPLRAAVGRQEEESLATLGTLRPDDSLFTRAPAVSLGAL